MPEDLNEIQGSEPRENSIEKPETKTKKEKITLSLVLNAVLLIAVVVLFLLYVNILKRERQVQFTGNGNISIAYVNTDSVLLHYNFSKDVEKQMQGLEKSFQNQYNASITAYQNEYNTYLKNGTSGKLTLDEQKKTEEMLAKKQQSLSELDQNLTNQLVAEKQKKNMEVLDTIINFVSRYNQTKHFTYILAHAYGGAVLYADKKYEITNEIIAGLNEEYSKRDKKNE
jgi:outer membrane protein